MPITINGTTGIAGVDGSAASPAVEGTDTDTGVFFPAAGVVGVANNGTERLRVDSSGNLVIGNTTALAKLDVGAVDSADEGGEMRLRGATNGTLDYYVDVYQSALRFVRVDKGTAATNAAVNFQIGSAGQWGIGGATYGTSGQVLTSGGASAAPTWSTKGMTLITTIATTSGTNPIASGLTLTPYRQLVLVFDGVSQNSGATRALLVGTSTADDIQVSDNVIVSAGRGFVWIDLNAGVFSSIVGNQTTSNNVPSYTGDMPFTTASTAVSIALNGTGSFNAGNVYVYGLS